MPVSILVTQGTTAGGTHAGRLMERITAAHVLADRGYDSDAIIAQAEKPGMQPTIPPRKHRTRQHEYDKDLDRLRHLIEHAFLHIKRWRGIATRDANKTASFLAAVPIRCLALWTNIS
jgi:transposase